MDDTILNFNYPTDTPKIIKVIGVGGGGGNAVTHMYKEGIHDVTFVLCNTDNQALNRSDVPIKLLLGREITQPRKAPCSPDTRLPASPTLSIPTCLSRTTSKKHATDANCRRTPDSYCSVR